MSERAHTLQELRTDLGRRADGLEDTGLRTRPRAVRRRVVLARRRRAAAAAVAAVLVVGGGIGALQLRPSAPLPAADRVVAGVRVPGEVALLGFPYAATRVEDLGSGDTLEVHAGEAVVLVGTGLGDGSATLVDDDGSRAQVLARVRGDEQRSVAVPVGPDDTTLSVRLDGAGQGVRAGVAVYAPTGGLAPGVQNPAGTAVFRDQVAGEPLLVGGFTRPGQRDLDLQVPAVERGSRLALWCDGSADVVLNVEVDGVLSSSAGCGGASEDAGLGTSAGYPGLASPRQDVHAYLSRSDGGAEIAPPDGVTFGVGVYRSEPQVSVPGLATIDRRIDADGRTWVLDRLLDLPAVLDTSSGERYARVVAVGEDVGATWTGRLDSGASDTGSGSSPFTLELGALPAGDRYQLAQTRGQGAVVAVYRPG